MNSALNNNITVLINEMLTLGIPIGEGIQKITDITSISYNSYNETLYIETKTKYYVIEAINPLENIITEFEKTNDQKKMFALSIANGYKNNNGGVQ